MEKRNGIPEAITLLDVKNLCWLAYIEDLELSPTSVVSRRENFEKWWAVKGTFLLTVPPIRAIYGFDD